MIRFRIYALFISGSFAARVGRELNENQEAWLENNDSTLGPSTDSWEPVTSNSWETTATTAATTIPPLICPVQWHGQNSAKIKFRNKNTFVVKVDMMRKYSKQEYLGFIIFPKFNCGLNFLHLVESGVVSVDIVDITNLYQIEDVYRKVDGDESSITFQIRRKNAWDRQELIQWNRDVFYLVIRGIDKVNWGHGNWKKNPGIFNQRLIVNLYVDYTKAKCIEKMFVGNGPVPTESGQHLAQCVADGKRLRWK